MRYKFAQAYTLLSVTTYSRNQRCKPAAVYALVPDSLGWQLLCSPGNKNARRTQTRPIDGDIESFNAYINIYKGELAGSTRWQCFCCSLYGGAKHFIDPKLNRKRRRPGSAHYAVKGSERYDEPRACVGIQREEVEGTQCRMLKGISCSPCHWKDWLCFRVVVGPRMYVWLRR